MKFYIFLILICVLGQYVSQSSDPSWCWTRSMSNEPNFVLDPTNGGLNWGTCQEEAPVNEIKYVSYVVTSQIEKSDTTSQVNIQIFGDKGKSDEILLSATGFERGSEKMILFAAKDVGKIQKISLRVVGNLGYRCRTITFKTANSSTSFECLKRVEPCTPGGDPKSCLYFIYADGDNAFEIKIKTADEENAATTSPVMLQLKGSTGESSLKMINELGLKKGTMETITVNVREIGLITGYKLMIGSAGKWKPVYLSIKNLVTGIIKNFEIKNTILISPGKDFVQVDENEKEVKEDEEEPEPEAENLNVHSPEGGLLENKEKLTIVNLTCGQKLINPSSDEILFGPSYPTRNINYMKILARCPSDCHKHPETVYGLGLHPESSPICPSAIIDNATSFYGGIISISIFPGMDNYKIPQGILLKQDNISIKPLSSKSTKKSYIVSKVDSVDLVDKDIRILNYEGMLAAEGRLEMRVEGKWGTLCSQGMDRNSANVVCRNLGYRGGEWKSPMDEKAKDFCKGYKGFDYCGAAYSKIHYSKVSCADRDLHFNECNKQIANMQECTHGFDAIINCYNENFVTEIPIPVGVIALAAMSFDNGMTTGRLEMYNQLRFSPVCDLEFNNESADVSCKQMGFLKGEFVSEPNINRAFKLDVNDPTPFSASNVACKGTEKSLKECTSVTNNIQCKHDQDVVIKCDGKGDITGKSQYEPKIITPVPELGKLGLKKYVAKCDTLGNLPMFRGDPGTVYIVECPALCSKQPASITGTGIYSGDSHVCLAAYHSGVIDEIKGGVFALIKTYGQTQFEKSSRNGIVSSPLISEWSTAFSLSQVNSAWMNMEKLFSETGEQPVGAPGAAPETIIQNALGRAKALSKLRPQIKKSFMELSVMEAPLKIVVPKPSFSFVEPNSLYKFQKNSSILVTKHILSELTSYSIILRFKLEKFAGLDQYIFSYSGCGGFNILIDKLDNLIIGNMCDPRFKIDTKIIVPLNESILLFITYEKNNIRVTLSSDKMGVISRSIKSTAEIKPAKDIGIGRMGGSLSGMFFGEINFVNVYDSVISAKLIDPIIEDLKTGNQEAAARKVTKDGRQCVSPCITESPGEGVPPQGAKLDDDNDFGGVPIVDIQGHLKLTEPGQGVASKGPNAPLPVRITDTKKDDDDFGTFDKSQENNQETAGIDCSTNLSDKRFSGAAGKNFRIHCPICKGTKANVFGTGIYHPLSSLCLAGVHAGILIQTKPGDIIVEITGEFKIFNGSQGKDKLISTNFGGSDRSFKVRSAMPLKKVKCETTAAQDIFLTGPVYSKFVVVCPPGCSKSKKAVLYGSEIYADLSSICYAAIHYGTLNDKGGEVEISILGEQTSYKSTQGFGIVSSAKNSYIRSFRFLGHRSALSFKYKETYRGVYQKKWKVVKTPNAIDPGNDRWAFKLENRLNERGTFEKFESMVHTGTIRVQNENNFASLTILKDADWANGIIKFNLKLVDSKPMGFVFRYQDSENYYGIVINIENWQANVKLYEKINSTIVMMDTKLVPSIRTETWIRCSLILDFENVKFFIQQDNIRENKLIFDKQMREINRGTMGFGSNGNNNFYLAGIETMPFNKNMKTFGNSKLIRSFENILKKTSFKDMKHFCVDIYRQKTSPDYVRCNQPHTFCQMKCDTEVPLVQESIVNFRCFKDCVRAVYSTNVAKLGKNEIVFKKWEPKVGMKVDFMELGGESYRPGVIKEDRNMMKKRVMKIEYTDDNGSLTQGIVTYPSDSIVQCGSRLSLRSDCLV